MGLLEDELRATFAHRVAAPPVVDDVAGRAIHRAGRIRRQRTVALSAVAVLVVGLGAMGVAAATGGGRDPGIGVGIPPASGDPSGSAAPTTFPLPPVGATLPVDVLNGDRIQTANGTVVSLVGLGNPRRAWRVAEGWLVETSVVSSGRANSAFIWLVRPSGGQTMLASGRSVMVSPGSTSRPGTQVGWAVNDQLFLGTYAGGLVTNVVSTSGVNLNPQVVVGAGVVLAGTRTGGGLDIWDMWFPDRGRYKPTTENPNGLSAMFGRSVDGQLIIGVFHNGAASCLGEIDPNNFTPLQSNCSHDFRLDDRVVSSPDGQRWAVTGESGVALYETAQVWSKAEPVATWPSSSFGPVVWLDSGSFVVAERTGVTTYYVDGRPPATVAVPASGVGGAILPIADLR